MAYGGRYSTRNTAGVATTVIFTAAPVGGGAAAATATATAAALIDRGACYFLISRGTAAAAVVLDHDTCIHEVGPP